MADNISEINRLIALDKTDEALALLDKLIEENPENGRLLFLMGKTLWKLGKRSQAISYYLKADAIEPDGPAKKALEMSRDIESYFNPDLLNP